MRPYRGKVHVHDVAKLTLGKVRDAGLPRGRHAVSKHSHEAHTAHVQRERELPRRLTLGSALVSTHSWSRLYLKSEGKPGVAGKLRHAAPHRPDLARFRSGFRAVVWGLGAGRAGEAARGKRRHGLHSCARDLKKKRKVSSVTGHG